MRKIDTMRNRVRTYVLGSFFVGMVAAGVAVTPSAIAAPKEAVPGIAPAGTLTSGVIAEGSSNSTSGDSAALAFGCTPGTGVDNPHRSSTGVAVSGHGWWTKGSCNNNTARVTVCLYEYYTDGSWVLKTCSTNGNLSAGGGSAARVTARRDCETTELTSWRSHVDVDVNSEVDTAEVPYRQADVACRISAG